MTRFLRRLRCAVGIHRSQLLYADTGDPARQYEPQKVCLWCAAVLAVYEEAEVAK